MALALLRLMNRTYPSAESFTWNCCSVLPLSAFWTSCWPSLEFGSSSTLPLCFDLIL
jgi:hypothetical protein